MATELFKQAVDYDYGVEGRAELMRKVWEGTPWMVDAFTGNCGNCRDLDMREWCREKWGQEHWPIHGKPGTWQRGSVTIHGWTWYGFATEEMMQTFLAAWPHQATTDKPPSPPTTPDS